MNYILSVILITLLSLKLINAQTFIPNDQRIGDPNVNYVNPEFSPIGNYMVWIEIDTSNGLTGKVWQCGVDPNTGNLIPPDGKGYNPFNSNVYARPADWGVDNIGPYYVGATLLGQIKFVRPTSPTSAIVTNISLPAINKRRVFYPSQLPGVDKRFVIYILNDSVNGFSSNTPQNSYYQLRLLDLDNPANDYLIEQQSSIYPLPIPMDVIVPRWIKGSHYLTFGYNDLNNNVQAKELNAYSPESPPIPVTNDLANKIDGYPVLNSMTNEQFFLSGINASDTAYFYKRSNFSQMFTQNAIVVPQSVNLANPALNQSHEPFLFNGKLYSAFQVNNDGGNFFNTTFNQPGEIWLTTIDSSQQIMWLLSQFDSTMNISEPEPYVGNNKVWVFYSAAKIEPNKPYLKRQFQLRRCDTPFNNISSVDEHKQQSATFKFYPNPTKNKITIDVPGFTNDYELTIYDILGRVIIQKSNENHLDISNVASGVYFLIIKTPNMIFKERFIKN